MISKQEIVETKRLRPNPWNSNIVTPENQAKVDASVARMGFFKPIVVREMSDGDFEILGGEHRWESALRLGIAEVPIYNVGLVDDKRAREISVADNARYGADDSLKLAEILNDIGTAHDLQDFLPMSENELADLFSSTDIALDALDDEEIDDNRKEDPEEPVVRLPKTHSIIRFKVTNADAERISDIVSREKVRNGFTVSDDLTNAGDALVYLLFNHDRSS